MRKLFWMLAALLFAGCEQSPIEEQSMLNQPEEFWATFEGADESDTRTYLDDQVRMRWTADDRLTIFKKTTYNREFAFTGKTGANAGGFKQVSVDDDFWFGYDVDYNYAIYPHSADNAFDETDCFFTTTMPAEQTYVENSFGLGANTMVAVSESGQLIFKNVGSYLRVMLYGENQTVKKITFTSNAGECVAGKAKVYATNTNEPTCTMVDDISSITLTCETPVEVNTTVEKPIVFWIVVPPVVLPEGYTVTVENAEGGTQTYKVNREKTFKRNVYSTLGRQLAISAHSEPEVDPTTPANNEIWYTTTDGTPIALEASAFGDVNIISNTYKDGKGVIACDGNVMMIADYAFTDNTMLTNIQLPNSVETIGICAFSRCTSLASVSFGSGLEVIGSLAFSDCSSLTSIAIAESVKKVDFGVFAGCDNLKEFKGKYATEDGRCLIIDGILTAFAPGGLTSYDIPTGVTSIGSSVFSGCNLTSITIPEGVETIGASAFEACIFTSLTIPEGVRTIGERAFSNSSVQTIELPNSLDSIKDEAFSGSKLQSIRLPNELKSIHYRAFYSCDSLASITFGKGTTEIGAYAFSRCNALQQIDIPNNITIGGLGVFERCSNLESATIDCEAIGQNAFMRCSSLTAVHIGDHVNTIGDQSFRDCTSLKTITMGKNVQSIKRYAFRGCSTLTSITIPESVTTIEHDTFAYCTSLSSVFCEAITPPTLESNAFRSNADNRLIYVPTSDDGSILNAYKTAAGWSDYADYIVEEGPANNEIWYTSTNGNIVTPYKTGAFGVAIKSNTYTDGKGVITFEGDVTTIGRGAFYNCTSLASFTIPEGVTTIGEDAFYYCRSLASITLPESLTTIGDNAFWDCTSLASITLPESLTTIGSSAFRGCTSLKSITLPEGVTTIGTFAFWDCTSLASITIPESVTELGAGAFANCSNLQHFEGKYASDNGRCLIKENVLIAFAPAGLTTYTVPEGVTTIGESAFYGCTSLASITLPEGVTTIGRGAFYNCRSLASITLPEGVTTIGYFAFSGCTSLASITLPESLTIIGDNAFQNCTSLASITLPEGVTTIGYYAFENCTSLKSVYCKPTTPPTGGSDMFSSNVSGRKIYVPASDDDSIINAYKAASYWRDYASSIEEYQF